MNNMEWIIIFAGFIIGFTVVFAIARIMARKSKPALCEADIEIATTIGKAQGYIAAADSIAMFSNMASENISEETKEHLKSQSDALRKAGNKHLAHWTDFKERHNRPW